MLYVQIELDNVLTIKRLKAVYTEEGFIDYSAIRDHFMNLGYSVGKITKVN